MLIVKPGLEIVEDQFADAEEEDAGATKRDVEASATDKRPSRPTKSAGQFDDADDQEEDPLL